ncbi:MAG: class I SAM-dependent methyltransferase [Actinomycetaceae bacterium]|nr:class I SAM-dependent methyltransferase [Actinomycetaceae bacterium]
MTLDRVLSLFEDSLTRRSARNLYTAEGAELYAAFVKSDEAEQAEVRYAGEALPERATVGELAAGEGRLLFSVPAERVSSYVALDSSPLLLGALARRAAEMGVDAQAVQALHQDLLKWEPEPHAFDLLIFGAGTARLFDEGERARIFSQVRNALKTGGRFYVSTSESLASSDRLICLGETEVRGRKVVVYFFDTNMREKKAREIGFVVFPIGQAGVAARVYSSIVLDLTADELVGELEAAGLAVEERIEREYESAAGIAEVTTSLIARIKE